eukprot:534372-Rhodomonas_salina.1
MGNVDTKIAEKDAAFEKFNGEPHQFFERLILVCSELRDLGEPDDEKRNVKREQEAIFAFALLDGATPVSYTHLRAHETEADL